MYCCAAHTAVSKGLWHNKESVGSCYAKWRVWRFCLRVRACCLAKMTGFHFSTLEFLWSNCTLRSRSRMAARTLPRCSSMRPQACSSTTFGYHVCCATQVLLLPVTLLPGATCPHCPNVRVAWPDASIPRLGCPTMHKLLLGHHCFCLARRAESRRTESALPGKALQSWG